MASDVDSIPIIKIFHGLFEHHAEEDSDESWCQNTTLLWWLRRAQSSLLCLIWPRSSLCSCMITFMYFLGHPIHPMICHIPLLLTVSNSFVRSMTTTYSALFCSPTKHHVCCAPEATLNFLKVIFSDDMYQSVQQNPCKDFSCDQGRSNPSVIEAVRFFLFVLVPGNYDYIVEILW